MLKSYKQALKKKTMNMRGRNMCSGGVFSLFLFAGYFQKSLTLFSKKDHHFKKILIPFSKQEATYDYKCQNIPKTWRVLGAACWTLPSPPRNIYFFNLELN